MMTSRFAPYARTSQLPRAVATRFTVLALAVATMLTPSSARAQLVNFESTSGNYDFITTAGAFTFDGFLSLDTRFGTGASSGTKFAYNRAGSSATIQLTGGGLFSVSGGFFSQAVIGSVSTFTSGSTGPTSVQIIGFRNGTQVAAQTLLLTGLPVGTTFGSSFASVDEIRFGAAPGGQFAGVFLDDFNAQAAITAAPTTAPEPATLLLVGSGLFAIGAINTRRKRSRE